ncbi:MAG TPA: PIG-L family deacetylase [Alphaproteobacteria bacterium]|nr:PIG-L family deacetylase [Alphaproteobacteria bacterium]
MKLLAIGAHPDDLEIYMFGTLAAAQAQGAELVLAIATDGARGGTLDPAELSAIRRREATAAASILGLEPRFLDFPDGTLTADPMLVGAVRTLIAETRPDLVLTHAPSDYHGDHRALSEATRIAANFIAPVLWADTMQGAGFTPTHYVDVTAGFESKCRAILAHVSQRPERFVAMARQLNGFRAAQANGGPGSYAEAYRFEPVFPFVDIRDLLPPAPPIRAVGAAAAPPG